VLKINLTLIPIEAEMENSIPKMSGPAGKATGGIGTVTFGSQPSDFFPSSLFVPSGFAKPGMVAAFA